MKEYYDLDMIISVDYCISDILTAGNAILALESFYILRALMYNILKYISCISIMRE
jgi:hypothetical protein